MADRSLIEKAAEFIRYMLALPDSMGLSQVMEWDSLSPTDADPSGTRVRFGRGTEEENAALLRARWLIQQHASTTEYEGATTDERRALWKSMTTNDIASLVDQHYGEPT